MFDTHSDYALNKADKNAIVCPSVTGEHIRLTREDFSSEEEFLYWKDWSDNDLHKIENDGQYDSRCLTLDTLRNTPTPSAEDAVLAPYIAAEKAERRRRLIEVFKTCLTAKQYRRMCLYYLNHMTEAEIAALEGVGQRRVSTSITSGRKIVEKFFPEFFRR